MYIKQYTCTCTYNIILFEILHIYGEETEKGVNKMLTRGRSKPGAYAPQDSNVIMLAVITLVS